MCLAHLCPPSMVDTQKGGKEIPMFSLQTWQGESHDRSSYFSNTGTSDLLMVYDWSLHVHRSNFSRCTISNLAIPWSLLFLPQWHTWIQHTPTYITFRTDMESFALKADPHLAKNLVFGFLSWDAEDPQPCIVMKLDLEPMSFLEEFH